MEEKVFKLCNFRVLKETKEEFTKVKVYLGDEVLSDRYVGMYPADLPTDNLWVGKENYGMVSRLFLDDEVTEILNTTKIFSFRAEEGKQLIEDRENPTHVQRLAKDIDLSEYYMINGQIIKGKLEKGKD